jgi:hypothetical protein
MVVDRTVGRSLALYESPSRREIYAWRRSSREAAERMTEWCKKEEERVLTLESYIYAVTR